MLDGKLKGFTVIELLVVVAIVAVLLSIVTAMVTNASLKARDSRRKADLQNIAKALDIYYSKYGEYPPGASNSEYGCFASGPVHTSCNPYSTLSTWFTALVSDGEFSVKAPVDPKNQDLGPWCYTGGPTSKNKIYTYMTDGQHYILCAWMENTSDPDTLQFRDVPNPWNNSQGLFLDFGYSGYNFVIAK